MSVFGGPKFVVLLRWSTSASLSTAAARLVAAPFTVVVSTVVWVVSIGLNGRGEVEGGGGKELDISY